MFRFFTLAILLIFLNSSCKDKELQSNAEKDATDIKVPFVPKQLKNTLDSIEAARHISFFHNELSTLQNNNFFFADVLDDSTKIISLELNKSQRNMIFEALDAAQMDSTNKTSLRVYMAANSSEIDQSITFTPNILPLLVLVKNDILDTIYYPLRAVAPLITESFDQLYSWQCDTLIACPLEFGYGKDTEIGCNCVKELINNWEAIPPADIRKQLYVNNNDSSRDSLIQYYSFDSVDTKKIYEFQKKLKQEDKPCYFYLHFGQLLEGPDYVPLRTIVHLDDNPIDVSQLPKRARDAQAYFEFAKPCPPYCGKPKK